LFIAAIACKKKDDKPAGETGYTPNCSGATPEYAANVSPIIFNECATAGCHGTGSTNGPGELLTYTQVKNAAFRIRTVQRRRHQL
jgi:hypothetical protein